MKKDVYNYFTDGLEVYNILRDAKATGKDIEVKVELFDQVTTLKSTDDPSVWREYFYCKTEADVMDRFVSKHKFEEKKAIMARAQFLERQFRECKFDIYPQRAQQYLDYLGQSEEFAEEFKFFYTDRVARADRPNLEALMRSPSIFSQMSRRRDGYPDRYFQEIRGEILDRRGSKLATDRFFNKETIYTELIMFYPGGAELVQKYDPEFLTGHPELLEVIAENQKFDRELASGPVELAIDEMPTDKAREQVKQITKGELDYLADKGYGAQFRTDTDQMDIEEIFDILREGRKTGTPISINGVSCDAPEEEWFEPIAGYDKETYLRMTERKQKGDAARAQIQADYVDTMADQIYPQRLQMWKKFVDMYTRENDWGDPVTIDYFIKLMTEMIPAVNSGSALKAGKVAKKIREIDGPMYTASIVNLMLFAKNGPEFVEKYFADIASIPSQQAELKRIKAENQRYRDEIAQVKQKK